MRFAAANMRDLITEAQHPAAYFFQSLRNGGDSTSDQCNQLLDFSFQFSQQRIVCLDLPIQFAAVSDAFRNNITIPALWRIFIFVPLLLLLTSKRKA